MRVQKNSIKLKPKRATAEWARSHIKMALLQKHKVNLADSIKFPNIHSDWQEILDMLKCPEDMKVIPQPSCDQCSYVAPEWNMVKRHVKFVHEKFRFTCDICRFKTCKKSKLKTHLETGCENIGRNTGKADPQDKAFNDFLKYCFSRSDVHIDKTLSQVEQERELFAEYGENCISGFFFDYFWSLRVTQKLAGTRMKPKRKTAEWTKSQIKMAILKKYKINLSDPVRFANHKEEWAAFISTLDP